MSKILIVSDIHIHDYPQRNPSNRYRLYQNRLVAQNIIDAGKGCDIIVFAGDILEKFDAKPYILAETKLFLDTIMNNFKAGYIIWGNHDMDNKSVDSDFIDSSLSVMLPANLRYADKQEITVDGCRIGFCNYRPEFDLSWISGTLDVLITHATIAYSQSDHVHSQKLDESKFNIAFCGDIHRPAQSGKYVSIGIPQKCKMGDFDDSTGIIFDCPTKQYTWVNLNPKNNLMKFQYTKDRAREGWNAKSGVWSVYKPDSIEVNYGQTVINIPAWTEIDHLVTDIIKSSGLVDLHKKILTDIRGHSQDEIDFNFTLTKLRCKNWRSIEDAEVYFNEGDKYLITGSNGSGKSSLLSALKYAFIDYPHYKEFIRFGAKSCEAEVEFVYQGNKCKILRGSGSCGCWINDVALKYNNKDEFKKDMRDRFPFIDYLEDVCFFNSDHPNFIGSLRPERKSEIISKFYKIDKIETYNKRAQGILEELRETMTKWQQEIEKNKKLLTYINEKLTFITLPARSLNNLADQREAGIELQKKYMLYTKYMTDTATWQASINASQERIKELENKKKSFRDKAVIESHIREGKARLSDLMDKYQQFTSILQTGRILCDNYRDLEKTKICSSCGQEIKPGHDLDKHKSELLEKIKSIANDRDLGYRYFSDTHGLTKVDVDSGRVSDLVNEINSKLAEFVSELKEQESTEQDIEKENYKINEIKKQLISAGPKPEKVELPKGFMEEMGKIESEIQVWQVYNGYITDKEKADKIISQCNSELAKIRHGMSDLLEYIKLTGPTGQIFEEIMTKLADQFTDNKVHYKVEKWTFRRQEHLELASYYFNSDGNEVPYSQCSDGQRTALDVDFLSKIVTRTGLMVMDEFLKYLDSDNLDIVVDSIKGINTGCLFLSSHASGIPKFYNRLLTTKLNDSGVTTIELV